MDKKSEWDGILIPKPDRRKREDMTSKLSIPEFIIYYENVLKHLHENPDMCPSMHRLMSVMELDAVGTFKQTLAEFVVVLYVKGFTVEDAAKEVEYSSFEGEKMAAYDLLERFASRMQH
jgi:hypothetical protein